MASKSSSSSGIGLTGVLFVVFLVLKLTGNIDWSWWWVTSPLWIPIVFLLCIVFGAIMVIMLLLIFGFNFDDLKKRLDRYKKNQS
jgi:membrane protein YdbS with pleckstrin-like domain